MQVNDMLRDAAHAYIRENAIVSVGDVVTTTWGSWKKPGRVRITHVGAELVCRWNGKDDWIVGFDMTYCAQRLRADGTVPEKAAHCHLHHFTTQDGRQWKKHVEPGGREGGFNHAGLAWGTFSTQRAPARGVNPSRGGDQQEQSRGGEG
jgi:hypothetical protein